MSVMKVVIQWSTVSYILYDVSRCYSKTSYSTVSKAALAKLINVFLTVVTLTSASLYSLIICFLIPSTLWLCEMEECCKLAAGAHTHVYVKSSQVQSLWLSWLSMYIFKSLCFIQQWLNPIKGQFWRPQLCSYCWWKWPKKQQWHNEQVRLGLHM